MLKYSLIRVRPLQSSLPFEKGVTSAVYTPENIDRLTLSVQAVNTSRFKIQLFPHRQILPGR